jgi:hypothetical protein
MGVPRRVPALQAQQPWLLRLVEHQLRRGAARAGVSGSGGVSGAVCGSVGWIAKQPRGGAWVRARGNGCPRACMAG